MSPLITPDVIEDQAIEVLRDKHRDHLAKLERERDLEPRTIEPLRTIDVLVGDGVRLREDKPPVALLGVFGTAAAPEVQRGEHLGMDWTLAVQVVVVGQDRRDTLRRRGWYAMVVAECLLQRLPRKGTPLDHLVLTDVDFVNGRTDDGRARTVGEAQLIFEARVLQTLALHDLPPADTTSPPDTPGGPPGDPYTPPVPWPPADPVFVDTDKEPLT